MQRILLPWKGVGIAFKKLCLTGFLQLIPTPIIPTLYASNKEPTHQPKPSGCNHLGKILCELVGDGSQLLKVDSSPYHQKGETEERCCAPKTKILERTRNRTFRDIQGPQ